MPASLPPVSAGALARAGLALNSINALGDSISAQPLFNPLLTPQAGVPAWLPSTAYVAGQMVQNGGYQFWCNTGGTSAASGGPTATGGNPVSDGSATWMWAQTRLSKESYVGAAEMFSLGALTFDPSQGYGGMAFSLIGVIVKSGGSNYTNPTITLNGGATATATVVGGVIKSVTLTNPGYIIGGFTVSVSDATGTGAVLSVVSGGSGTFSVPGCTTRDMVARMDDPTFTPLNSNVNLLVIMGGRNDIVNSQGNYAQIVANLQYCAEKWMAAGRRAILCCILPCYQFTAAQSTLAHRVNRWIRAYCRGDAWANPNGYTAVALADATHLFLDRAQDNFWPVGGAGSGTLAVTYDGTHPNPRGKLFIGSVVWQAAQKFVGNPNALGASRAYGLTADGYDPVLNPGGNYVEALPWAASTAYVPGQKVSLGGQIYRCNIAGNSGTTGPTGTGTFTESGGTVQWSSIWPTKTSVFGGGAGGTLTAATGITYSGSLAKGYTLARTAGTASGNITAAIESPWSDGTQGTRQALTFSLGSGTNSETWQLRLIFAAWQAPGFASSDLGATGTQFYGEMELELSGLAGLSSVFLHTPPTDPNLGAYNYAGTGAVTATGYNLPASSGEPWVWPNNGRLLLRTAPAPLLANQIASVLLLQLMFNASGGAGSATATLKLNSLGVFKAGLA